MTRVCVRARRFVQYNGGVSKKQLSWLEDQLAEASRAGQRVISFGHVPIHPADNSLTTLLWNYDDVRVCVCVIANVFFRILWDKEEGYSVREVSNMKLCLVLCRQQEIPCTDTMYGVCYIRTRSSHRLFPFQFHQVLLQPAPATTPSRPNNPRSSTKLLSTQSCPSNASPHSKIPRVSILHHTLLLVLGTDRTHEMRPPRLQFNSQRHRRPSHNLYQQDHSPYSQHIRYGSPKWDNMEW